MINQKLNVVFKVEILKSTFTLHLYVACNIYFDGMIDIE